MIKLPYRRVCYEKTFIINIFILTLALVGVGGVAYAQNLYPNDFEGNVFFDEDGDTNFTNNYECDIFVNDVSLFEVNVEIQYRKNYLLCRKVDVRADKTVTTSNSFLVGVVAFVDNYKQSNYDGKVANYTSIAHCEVTASYSSVHKVPELIMGEVFLSGPAYAFDYSGAYNNKIYSYTVYYYT